MALRCCKSLSQMRDATASAPKNGMYMKPLMRVRNKQRHAPTDNHNHRDFLSRCSVVQNVTSKVKLMSENASVGISVTGNLEKKAWSGLRARSAPATSAAPCERVSSNVSR